MREPPRIPEVIADKLTPRTKPQSVQKDWNEPKPCLPTVDREPLKF